MRFVIDAMGGDYAPEMPVRGAVNAVKEFGYEIVLVGKEEEINSILKGYSFPKEKITIVNATEVIGMDEPAALSVRKKKDNSITRGLQLLKKEEADAFISAGNTGAVVCAATLNLRLLPGVDRPGIAVIIPTLAKPCMVIDVGANIDPKPLHILQYGIMGDAYSRHVLGKTSPTIALLNIGEESTKGNDFVKEAHLMMAESKLNFIGNIEPKEVYEGHADVVVCDGFVGNVFLKVSEGFAYAGAELLKRELKASNIITKIGAFLALPAFKAIKKKVDAREYGGAPLLGVDGRVLISHGSSDEKAIKNAVRTAAEYINQQVNVHIVEALKIY
ncbi:glycerol-3-phosphate acyltransferase PlsX [Candidatus Omnitrophus magneticus]|uniref:Phosphate acyltransferase n=1 Tax=Candidatus Omnitrophus magneticus TaxID=1609969 RepID=A0A0F0CTI1_9BACT|nr:glycerol-3-phosphate acyltransferase PlsX [Candidatus Omnitrophus magneticus]